MQTNDTNPILTLRCACCGGCAQARQWHNQDAGYGLCDTCATWIEGRETAEYMQKCYGSAGIHYKIVPAP